MPLAEPGFLAVAGAAWLLSFALHSSLALGGVALLVRSRRLPAALEHTLWRSALLGSLATATVLSLGLDGGAFGAHWRLAPSTPAPVPAAGAMWVPHGASGSMPAVSAHLSPAWTWSVLAVWALSAGLGLLRLAGARSRLRRELGVRRVVTGGEVRTRLDRLCRVAGVRRPVQLTVSPRLGAPIAIGHGEICLPERAIRDLHSEELESALAHELGHLERRDPAWKGLAAAIGAVFFFQPLLPLARRRLAESAEYLADDWAVKHLGTGMPLARCLAAVAGWQAPAGLHGVPVSAMSDGTSPLVRRVERILGHRPRDVSWKLQALGATAFLAAVWSVAPGVTAVPGTSAPVTAAVLDAPGSPPGFAIPGPASLEIPPSPPAPRMRGTAPGAGRVLVLVVPEGRRDRAVSRAPRIHRLRPLLRDQVTAPVPRAIVIPHAEFQAQAEHARLLHERSRAQWEALQQALEQIRLLEFEQKQLLIEEMQILREVRI